MPRINQPEVQEVPDPLDLGLVTGNLGGGEYRVDIQDESGKINVNIGSRRTASGADRSCRDQQAGCGYHHRFDHRLARSG